MSMTTKYVFVTWFGADVGFAKRGKYGVVSGSIAQYFDVRKCIDVCVYMVHACTCILVYMYNVHVY